MLRNFAFVVVGLLVGLSFVSYTFTSRIKSKPSPVTTAVSASLGPSSITEEVRETPQVPPVAEAPVQAQPIPQQAPAFTTPDPEMLLPVQKPMPRLREVPEVLPTDEPLDTVNETTEIPEITASGYTGTRLTPAEKRRIEEAQESAGWANEKYLPQDALDVIRPAPPSGEEDILVK